MTINHFITFDNGNSHPHLGIFEHGSLQRTTPYQLPLLLEFMEKGWPVIVSNVANLPIEIARYKHLTRVAQFKTDGQFLDMPMEYTRTIGDDRVVQIYYLYKTSFNHQKKMVDDQSFCLIDAGTFITMDFFSKRGHHGGFIYPGAQTFLNSYHRGKNLPELHLSQESITAEKLTTLPHNTDQAILLATHHYLQNTILQTILRFGPVSHLFITGGDSDRIQKIVQAFGPLVTLNVNLIHEAMAYFYQVLTNQKEKPLPETSL